MLRSISDVTLLTCFLTLIFVQNTGHYISLEGSPYQLSWFFSCFLFVNHFNPRSVEGIMDKISVKIFQL